MRYFTFLTVPKSLKPSVYFSLRAHLNLGAEISWEMLDLRLDFIKFANKKVDSRIQVIQNIHKSFSVTETNISIFILKFKN